MAPPPDTVGTEEALAEAIALEAAGEPESALRIYLALAARDPHDADANYRAGTALMRRGDLDDAVTLLRRVVFSRPDHAPARANLGNALLLLGRDEQAREAFIAVLKNDPDNRNALYGLATILIRLGRHAEAQKLSARLLAALPDSAAALTLDADARGSTGDASAVAQYRHALRLDPDYLPALKGLAGLLFHQGRTADAEAHVRHALRRAPADVETRALLGSILLAREDWPGALDALGSAHEHDPDNPEHLVNMSLACRRAGDVAGALAHARDAWQVDGGNKAAANALGAALAAAGAGIQAREVLMAGGKADHVPAGVWRDVDALVVHLRETQARAVEERARAHAASEEDHSAPQSSAPQALDAGDTGPAPTTTPAEPDDEPDTLPLFPEH
ncbi:tetratricopeptide repeat protein [Stappia sp.]|uniref:tetratricopeptide repeat protein n=1 Tax=Stappia sp. TaxID=1870903 RepID=UPI003A9A2F69